jgi:ABC-type glycerol-3-phosphate transport system substrate-binding protein
MPRNRRHVLAVALAGLLLLSAAGCTQATPTPEPIILSFACLEYESAHYEPLAEAYHNAHPNVTIQLLPRRNDALQNMGAGDADVFTLAGGIQARQERGDFLSLDAWFTGDDTFARDDFYPGTLELYLRDGKTWAIPISLDVAVMYYNKDLFDERQVPYPRPGWTWDDFLNTAINLSDASLGI